jgi:hypothetical protein
LVAYIHALYGGRPIRLRALAGTEVPAGMGEDYVVYVDDFENPTRIVGYRDGANWYDESGDLEANPKRIADQSGGIKPFLKHPEC